MDQSNRQQRATKLVDFLSHYCNEEAFSAFCESVIAVGQKGVVDTYFRRNAGNLQTPGIHVTVGYYGLLRFCLRVLCLGHFHVSYVSGLLM